MTACLAGLLAPAQAQLALGTLEGSVEDAQGRPASTLIEVTGPVGARLSVQSADGMFRAALPYGEYTVSAAAMGAECRVRIFPLATAYCDLRPGRTQAAESGGSAPAGAMDAAESLLVEAPGVFSYPVDFAGTGEIRLPAISLWSASWTATGFRLNGLDATDSYQPGRPLLLDDAAAADSLVAMASDSGMAAADMYTVGIYLRGAGSAWHGGLATTDTGAAFAGDNLPSGADRGSLERPDEFQWFTRDTAELSGPIGRYADIAATATGQWASQTMPASAAATAIRSRMLFANTRGRVRVRARDQVDALYSGSRLDLSNGGWPAGMEAILANRAMPSFYGVDGFAGLREVDHFDHVQAGWTHSFADGAGAWEVRYGYSTAHLDTLPSAAQSGPSRIDLLDLAPAEAPLTNFAVRTRHQVAVAYQDRERRLGGASHRLSAGGNWETSQPRNRFQATGGEDLITAGGQPALTVLLNTPADTRFRLDSFAPYAADTVRWSHGVTTSLAIVLDGARGGPIRWVSPSPRAAIALPVPGFERLTLRGSYARLYSALAGRYLDFGDPASLTGLVYDSATGQLLQRFGGAYSSIAAHLQRPYTDQFHLAAEAALPWRSNFTIDLLRADRKNRIAAVNTGVTAADFYPVALHDPGPDFIPGTFDDQVLTVYAQDPASLGRDRYLLTNPAGLRELTEAVTAAAATHHGFMDLRVSFTAEKSFGPTNPGSSVWSNDPGIVGALYGDPNSLLNATGHPFVDRAFLGKFEEETQAPGWLGGVRLVNIVDYMDGLPFARELLVSGLPQGPFLVDTTLRGSPEGGNRAQYVLNWNLRLVREFPTSRGRFSLTADLLNVLNNGNKIAESDLSGPHFDARPALALPSPRILRLAVRWQF